MSEKHSDWTGVYCNSADSRETIRRLFSPMCDDMTPLSAEVLADRKTDQTKKMRASMKDKNGAVRTVTRTFGKRYSITLSPPRGSDTP